MRMVFSFYRFFAVQFVCIGRYRKSRICIVYDMICMEST